ncbi:MAG: TatD family hydrolase [Thiolinea sp.]
MRLVDTHCHFDDPGFDVDRAQQVQAMRRQGVSDLVFPAITAATWPRLRAIVEQDAGFHAAYGLHPVYLQEHRAEHLQALRQWLLTEPAVAVGECGLDFFLPELDREQQQAIFIQHLHLAREFDLPLIIHARRALDEVLKQLRRVGGLRGVIHSFAGSLQQAEQLIEQGFYLGIGGTVTYERAQRLRRVVAAVPENRLLLETDAPDQPDSQWRGRRNEPGRLPVIAAAVAELRGMEPQQLADITTANAQTLFGIP